MNSKRLSLIMNAIIILLCLNMIALVYMHAARSTFISQSNTPAFDNSWIVENYDETAFAPFDPYFALPSSIVYKQPGQAIKAVYDDIELLETVYIVLSDILTDIFGNKSIISDNKISYEAAVSEVLACDSYIIFEYSAELPYPFIYAFSSGQSSLRTDMLSSSPSAYVSRIAILITETENATEYKCYCFDDKGNAFEFKYLDGEPYILSNADSANLYGYSADFETVDFSNSLNPFFDNFMTDGFDILYGGFEFSHIASRFDISQIGLGDDIHRAELLDIFEMNPEKTNSYVELDGTTAFIGLADRLVITNEGHLEFSTQDSVSMKSILGYSARDSRGYTMLDMLKASNVLITKLSSLYPALAGDQAKPKLTSAYKASDGRPVFEYSYFYNGIRIDSDPAYVMTFSASGLTSLDADLRGYYSLQDKSATLSKSAIYKRLSKDSYMFISRLIPVYVKNPDGIFTVDWYGK